MAEGVHDVDEHALGVARYEEPNVRVMNQQRPPLRDLVVCIGYFALSSMRHRKADDEEGHGENRVHDPCAE